MKPPENATPARTPGHRPRKPAPRKGIDELARCFLGSPPPGPALPSLQGRNPVSWDLLVRPRAVSEVILCFF